MTDRETALRAIQIGDIFYAETEGNPTRYCLAPAVSDNTVLARTITTQDILKFDRHTGIAPESFRGKTFYWTIRSVAPLPPDIHAILIDLDRAHREFECRRAEDSQWEPSSNETRLTKEQTRGLLFAHDFYPAHPI